MTFRLHSRLVIWNLLIIGIIVGILAYYLSSSLRDHIETQIQERLLHETSLAAAFFAQTDPAFSLDDQADRLGEMLDVRVTVIAHDGRVLGDSDLEGTELQTVENHKARPEVMEAAQYGTGAAVRWNPTEREYFINAARRADPYIIRLAMPLSGLESLMADLRSQLLFAALIAVGLTLLFGYLVRGLISVPLRKISSASTRLAAGQLDQRLPISGDEEIAALGNSLNTMARNLNLQMLALSDEKQRLELTVGAMTEGVMVLNSLGHISLTNRALHALLGSGRDLVGKTPLEVFRIPGIETAVRSVLQGGRSQMVELTLGNARIIQANVAPVADVSGAVDSVVIVFHDLTEIRRTERMRRDFVANVSHEFKTPLTSIRGYSETLLSGALKDPAISIDFVHIIERNARHLETLVTDLLTLARIEAELPVSVESIDVKSVVDEQIHSRRTLITDKQIAVVNECRSFEIRSDRVRLSAAISNLLDNAIYYNRPGGEVRITSELSDGSVQIAIADTGQGIPSDEIPRIFERFYRVDKARSRETGRTGLGLSIVKHAIESQGGSLYVTSRIGVGSTFTIKLPVTTT